MVPINCRVPSSLIVGSVVDSGSWIHWPGVWKFLRCLCYLSETRKWRDDRDEWSPTAEHSKKPIFRLLANCFPSCEETTRWLSLSVLFPIRTPAEQHCNERENDRNAHRKYCDRHAIDSTARATCHSSWTNFDLWYRRQYSTCPWWSTAGRQSTHVEIEQLFFSSKHTTSLNASR